MHQCRRLERFKLPPHVPFTEANAWVKSARAPRFDMGNPAESKPGSAISLGETRSEPGMTNLEELPDVTPVEPTMQTIRHNYRAGEVIADKYRLLSMLGEGGMGTVWVAHNEVLDVQVALKLIRSEAGSVGNTERLLNEARAAACLKDPGIVTIFDFGTTPWGDPFIVMEVLNGEDLDQAIQRKGQLNPLKAVRVLLPIAKALAMAHSRGIIHRDLKPENIFLSTTNDGGLSPKLLDFGIAKVDHGPTLRLTTTGTLMGSPLYMSPEQARGEEASYSSDIWGSTSALRARHPSREPTTMRSCSALPTTTRTPNRSST